MSRERVQRVLVCEDSRTYSAALVRAIEHGAEFKVVGAFTTAEEAIAALPGLTPDLVTMDIELPGMSGLEAVEQIMGRSPLPIVVLSAHVGEGTEQAAAALAAGALDAVAKDGLDLRDPESTSVVAFRKRMGLLSRARVIRHPRSQLRAPASPSVHRSAAVVGICASTGGPHALLAILSALPETFPLPVLAVQHMSAGFIAGFASWLNGVVPLPVRLAVHGQVAERGIWIAPDEAHLTLSESGRFELDHEMSARHRPSGDVLLRSLAQSVGSDAVAVVLTGMGRDGADGLAAVKARGGLTIAQDEATSVIFGMPHAAAQAGAELVLPLERIGPTIAALAKRAARA